MYLDYKSKRIKLNNSEEMENLFDQTFGDDSKSKCKQLINLHIVNKCGTVKNKNLSLANCYIYELYSEHEQICKAEGTDPMEKASFSTICGKVVKELGYNTKRRKKRYICFL